MTGCWISTNQISQTLRQSIFACYLKNNEGEIIGGLTSEITYENIYVKYFWVSKKIRNNGHGKALLSRLEQEALTHKIDNIHLDTFSFQAPEFYSRLGFKEVGRFKDYPKKGVDKIFFSKKIMRA